MLQDLTPKLNASICYPSDEIYLCLRQKESLWSFVYVCMCVRVFAACNKEMTKSVALLQLHMWYVDPAL